MADTQPSLSSIHKKLIIWSLFFLFPIAGMTTDLVAPSLPNISHSLQESESSVKLVITLYLIGYAFGNFISGFLADAWGRQKILRFTLLGFSLVSILPVISPNLIVLLIARTLQGLMMGGFSVSSRAIFSDILSSEELISMGTLMGTLFGFGPVLGPIIGGYLEFYFGWQSCFMFFALTTVIGLIAVFLIVPETHFNRHPLHLTTIAKNITSVLKHRVFIGLILIMGCTYSLIISFHTLAPFLIESTLHHSAVFFGHLAFGLGAMYLLATITSRHLLKKYTAEKIILFGIHLFLAIALIGLFISYFKSTNIFLIIAISGLMFYAAGTIFPLSMGKGMSLFRHIAGTSTATMFLVNTLTMSLVAFLMGFINIHSSIPMLWVDVSLLLSCLIIYRGLMRKHL